MEQSVVILSFTPPNQPSGQGQFAALKLEKGSVPRYLISSAATDFAKFIKDTLLFVFDGETVWNINHCLGPISEIQEIIEVKELLMIFYPSLCHLEFEELGMKLEEHDPGLNILKRKFFSPAHRDVRILLSCLKLCRAKGLQEDLGFIHRLEEYTKGLSSAPFISFLKKEMIKLYPDRPIRTGHYSMEGADNLFTVGDVLPESEKLQLSAKWVVSCFQDGGLLSQSFPGYENRGMQAKMAGAIVQGFTESRDILIEAGTGTGKSLAYLIPSLWWARKNKKRVVIATHTITLQEQLYGKDLPMLENILPFPFQKALLKGKSNYLCLKSFFQDKSSAELSERERLVNLGLFTWLRETITGDFQEVDYLQKISPIWRRYGADNPYCQPGQCRLAGQCYLFKARRRADEADLIVINHSLLLADLKTNYKILPEYSDLIIDEAHNLYQTALKQLGFELSLEQMARFLEDLDGGKGSLLSVAQKNRSLWPGVYPDVNWSDFYNTMECLPGVCREILANTGELFRMGQSILRERLNIRIDESKIGTNAYEAVLITIENLLGNLKELNDLLARINNLLALENNDLEAFKMEVLKNKADLAQISEGLKEILAAEEGKRVTYLEKSNTLYLKNTLIAVDEILREKIFRKNNCTVLTSATLTAAGSFDSVARDLGVENTLNLQLESPFDYDRQMLFCVVNDLQPEQWSEESSAIDTACFLQRIAEVMGGRTLVLFTSHRHLRLVQTGLKDALNKSEVRVLAQGIDGPREVLLEEFTKNSRSILLGTSSFWEGIDLPGDNLRCVIMSKLPFWPPDSPVLEAKSRLLENQGGDPFQDLHLPEAIIRFKQGFGRLIRTKEDKGVVILLDDRIIRKVYGRSFLKSLPIRSYFKGSSENVLEQIRRWV